MKLKCSSNNGIDHYKRFTSHQHTEKQILEQVQNFVNSPVFCNWLTEDNISHGVWIKSNDLLLADACNYVSSFKFDTRVCYRRNKNIEGEREHDDRVLLASLANLEKSKWSHRPDDKYLVDSAW